MTKAPVAEGFVRTFSEGTMDITSSQDVSSWLRAGQAVSVYIYNASMGECLYTGVVKEALLHHARFEGMQLVTNRQQRSNTRVDADLAYVLRYYREGKEEKAFETPLPVTILNVSAEGVFFSCKTRFDIGFQFIFAFRETPRDIPLTAEIVRREVLPGGFRYGCKFVGISVNDENEIHRWVFSQQIEQRRQRSF